MAKQVYEYVVVYNDPNGKDSKVIVPRKEVFVENENVARTLAARDIPMDFAEKLAHTQTLVRRFA